MTTLGLKNVNMLTKEQYDTIAEPVKDELYAISGSGFGFPSSKYEDLELGASGTEYTAPANGWILLGKTSTASGQFVSIINNGTQFGANVFSTASGQTLRVPVQCKKGDKIMVAYSAAGTTAVFRFIYAEGE